MSSIAVLAVAVIIWPPRPVVVMAHRPPPIPPGVNESGKEMEIYVIQCFQWKNSLKSNSILKAHGQAKQRIIHVRPSTLLETLTLARMICRDNDGLELKISEM